jgi:hypothetical protein
MALFLIIFPAFSSDMFFFLSADAAKIGGVYDFCVTAGWVDRSTIDAFQLPADYKPVDDRA